MGAPAPYLGHHLSHAHDDGLHVPQHAPGQPLHHRMAHVVVEVVRANVHQWRRPLPGLAWACTGACTGACAGYGDPAAGDTTLLGAVLKGEGPNVIHGQEGLHAGGEHGVNVVQVLRGGGVEVAGLGAGVCGGWEELEGEESEARAWAPQPAWGSHVGRLFLFFVS